MFEKAEVLSFPTARIVRKAPEAAKPQRKYSISPEAKWMLFRSVREDTELSADAVAVMGRLLDYYRQEDGFTAQSIPSITKGCRFFANEHRRHDNERTFVALTALEDAGWITAERYEIEPGSGFPGFKFFPVNKTAVYQGQG